MNMITSKPVYALSIAGPFGRWLVGNEKISGLGRKSIELRSWKVRHRDILVLIHVSQSTDYDHHFTRMPFTRKDCPKSCIIGAAVLKDIILYQTEDLWRQDQQKHCWVGDESFDYIYTDCYRGTPYGHTFVDQLLFEEPILNVPGDRGYWQPNPKKPIQQAKQEPAFNEAIRRIQAVRPTMLAA